MNVMDESKERGFVHLVVGWILQLPLRVSLSTLDLYWIPLHARLCTPLYFTQCHPDVSFLGDRVDDEVVCTCSMQLHVSFIHICVYVPCNLLWTFYISGLI